MVVHGSQASPCHRLGGKVDVKNRFYSENMFRVIFELGGLRRIIVEVIDLEGDVGGLQVKDVRKGPKRSQL